MRSVVAARRSALSMAGWLSLAVGSAAQTDFPLPIFETGGGATAFAYGDLNLDGRPDAAVVHGSTDKLGIILGKPGGFFGSPTLLATGDDPQSVAIADFDLDGRPDVVCFNRAAGTLTVVLLKPSGNTTWTVPAGGNGYALDVGDLDHDGDADVVTMNYTQKTVSVVLGLGAAGFGAPVTYPVGALSMDILLADLDGDGSLDVATPSFNPGGIMVRLGDGSGGLLAATTLAPGLPVSGLVAADLDADLDVDLATGTGTDLLLLRNGPAGFLSPEFLPMGANIHTHVAGDFDLDGVIDLIVGASQPGFDEELSLIGGTGGGAFAAPVKLQGFGPVSVVMDDVDDDQRPDLILPKGGLCVLRGDGEGGVVSHPAVALASEASLFALGDVDGDGFDDLVSANAAQGFPFSLGGPVHVQLGDGQGGWGAPQLQSVEGAAFLVLADVTGDGALDLLTTYAVTGHAIVIAPGDGAGGFGAPTDLALPSERASRLAAADLDDDGDVDLAVLSILEWFMGTQFRNLISFRNDGAGQWTSFLVNYGDALQFGAEDNLELADCDGNGHIDVAIIDGETGALSYCAGFGTAAFTGPQFVGNAGVANGDHRFAVDDLDGDGANDFIVAATNLTVFFGAGDGNYSQGQSLGPGAGGDVRLVDLDGDGVRELVTGSTGFWSENVSVWHANGAGGFTRHRYFSPVASRSFLTDVGQDGRLDLLTVPAYDGFLLPEPGDGHLLLNHTLSAAWTDFGHGLAGSLGVPKLEGLGTLKAGSPGSLKLTNANPSKLAVLFIGPTANPTPFKGGMLVPIPPTIMFTLFTSPTGSITVGWNSWKLMPPGTDWFFQYGIVDTAGPAGASLSNAVRALQP